MPPSHDPHITQYLRSLEVKAVAFNRKLRSFEIDSIWVIFESNWVLSFSLDFFQVESKRRPVSNFIEAVQIEITATMRGIVVDWLVEVTEEYELSSEALYLAVSYMDRFLSFVPINLKKFQLLGVSSMLIAS